MSVLVDTSVWSLAFRRKGPERHPALVQELRVLCSELRAELIGPIRQEVLSGVRHVEHVAKLKNHLRPFPDLRLLISTYELAAEFFNLCRRRGVQGSNTDFLICAAARENNLAIFTVDKDFELFRPLLGIKLHSF